MDEFHQIKEVYGSIYVREWGKGLQVIEGDSLVLLKGGEIFANERVYVMLPFPDEDGTILFVTRTMGMFKYDGIKFIPFKTEADQFVADNLIYTPGAILYDGNILLGTLNDGAIVIDRNGKLIRKFNRASGIISTVIYFTFQDRSGAIWLPTDNGISRIDYASQVSYFDSRNDFSTTAYQIIRHDGIIYTATNNGVYYLDPKTSNFKQLDRSKNQSFSFLDRDKEFLVGTSDGLAKIDEYSIIPIRRTIGNEFGVNTIKQSKTNQDRVYIGATGLWSMYKNENGWLDEGQILDITDPVNSIEEENNGTLWIGTNASGTYRIVPQKDDEGNIILEKPDIERFDENNGLPSGIIYVKKLNGENYFLSAQNFYRFDKNNKSFYLDNTYKVVSSLANYISPNNIVEDNLRRLWISLGREPALGTPQPDGKYQWLTSPFKRFSNEIIQCIYPENNGIVWFSTSTSIIKYDLTKNNFYNSEYSAIVRRVEVGTDSVLYFGGRMDNPTIPKITYHNNAIKFTFAAPSFEDETANQFKTFLEGFDEDWSGWAKENRKEYTNLSPGNYAFKVIAKNVFEIESKEAFYSFEILAPWYRTWIAYFVYVLILAALVFFFDRLQRRRLMHKAKERMKIQEAEHRAESAELQAQTAEAQALVIQKENERKTKELEEARELQLSMLPKELPKLPHLDIAVYMQTATEVGGDYYDFHVGLDGTLTAVVGDATGHGMRAGTMVTSTKSLFSSYANDKDIIKTFHEMTRCYKNMQLDNLSMCLTMVKITNDQLQMSSAGMPPIYIYRKETSSVEEQMFEGMPLGTMNNFPYEMKERSLNTGDTILMLSDGLPELMNASKEVFGYDRLRYRFQDVAEKSAEEIISKLKEAASDWVNGVDPDDDVTFVVIKVT